MTSLQSLYESLPLLRDAAVTDGGRYRHSIVIPLATYSPWLEDADFLSTYQTVKPNTLVDMYRAYSLWTLLSQTKALEGDILEVGVWRGGTGCLIAARAKTLGIACTTHLCDTFQGVAKAGSNDSIYRGGEHNDASAEIVGRLVSQLGLLNVEIREGLFPDQTAIEIEQNRFRFCHIDVDVYESARQTLEWIWPRLVPGGVVVFDDYGFINCDGVSQIVNEQSNNDDRITLHNLNGQAVIVKTR